MATVHTPLGGRDRKDRSGSGRLDPTSGRYTLALLAFLILPLVPHAASAADTWTNPEAGISRLHRTSSGPLSIHAIVVDLCDPSLELRATKAGESPRRTSAWGTLVGARAAINGDFYNTASGTANRRS